MKRTRNRKGEITTLPTRTDEHAAHNPADIAPELGPPMTSTLAPAGATVAEAAQAVADEKLVEAKAKPRRVGPLRRIHMATLERAQELSRPLVEQLLSLRRQVNGINAKAIDDVLEDLGATPREKGEDARVVEEEGETYVELMRAPASPAKKVGPKA